MTKARVTRRDVAQRARVSPAVVSYVINNGPRSTAPETRERVLQAIKELSYQPNASARGLRAQRTRTIGYISYDYYPQDVFVSQYNAGVMTGLAASLKGRQHFILPYPLGVGEDLADLDALLRSGRLDGLVIRLAEDPPITDPLLEAIAVTNVPCVCIERAGAQRFGCSSVTYDDENGAYEATRYLVERGHRRIAHIQGDLRQQAPRNRLAGYRRALAESGLPIADELIEGGSWVPQDTTDSMRRLLTLADPPTAVFAASDDVALSVIEVARDHGKRIPHDLAVIGFDDAPLARVLVPALTTVRIPLDTLSHLAADLILRAIHEGHTEPIAMTVPLALIRRGTV